MSDCPAFPPHLEALAVDDALFERAYEALGAEGRAALKQNIALLHVYWGEHGESQTRSRDFRQGFRAEEHDTPAPFTLLVCDAAYAFPACLTAALMPAVSAGCPLLVPCFIAPEQDDAQPGNLPAAAPLLAALELMGVERAFAAQEAEALEFLEHLCASLGRGRLLLLGDASWRGRLLLRADALGLSCRALPHPSVLSTPKPSSESAAGSRAGAPTRPAPSTGRPTLDTPRAETPELVLDAAHADLWVWPDLPPQWFRNLQLRLSALEEA